MSDFSYISEMFSSIGGLQCLSLLINAGMFVYLYAIYRKVDK